MKIFLSTLFILLACVLVASQKKEDWKISTSYDRFKDITTIMLEPMSVSESQRSVVRIFAAYQCADHLPCKPDGVALVFMIFTLNEKYEGEGIIRGIRDGVREPPYKLTYLGWEAIGSDFLLPTHNFRALLTPESVAKIANSKTIEFQIDNAEFAFSEKNLGALKALVGRMP